MKKAVLASVLMLALHEYCADLDGIPLVQLHFIHLLLCGLPSHLQAFLKVHIMQLSIIDILQPIMA